MMDGFSMSRGMAGRYHAGRARRGGLDAADEEDLSALRALAEQLGEEGAPADEVRDESALQLDEMARRLDEEAERDAAAADEITERFAELAAPEAPPSARELDEALRRGDFGAAGDELEQLLDRAGELSDEQRSALAEHLRDLGELAQESSRTPDPAVESRRSELEDALRSVDEAKRKLREKASKVLGTE